MFQHDHFSDEQASEHALIARVGTDKSSYNRHLQKQDDLVSEKSVYHNATYFYQILFGRTSTPVGNNWVYVKGCLQDIS